jgi:hypothetical protein
MSASHDEFSTYFRKEGFTTFTNITLRDKCGFIRFTSQADADLFAEHFSDRTFKGEPLRIEKCSGSSQFYGVGDKTLCLSGFPAGAISERHVYYRLLEFGFIRRVRVEGNVAYVEFDTVQEAHDLLHRFPIIEINDIEVHVSRAEGEQNHDARALSVPLKELIPPDHAFWSYLRDLVYDSTWHLK